MYMNEKGSILVVDRYLQNTLINMCVECIILKDARRVFDQMLDRNVVSWTAMIAGYAKEGIPEEALSLFWKIQGEGVEINQFTFSRVLPTCTDMADLEQGLGIHQKMIMRGGFQSNVIVMTTLVDMYAKCGRVDLEHKVFNKIPPQNLIS